MKRTVAVLVAILVGACSDSTGPQQPVDTDSDNDGIANVIDSCPNTPETFNNWADADGCPDDSLELFELVRTDLEIQWAAEFQQSGFVYRPITGFTSYISPIIARVGSSVPSTPSTAA